jgi:hypothetical protein
MYSAATQKELKVDRHLNVRGGVDRVAVNAATQKELKVSASSIFRLNSSTSRSNSERIERRTATSLSSMCSVSQQLRKN